MDKESLQIKLLEAKQHHQEQMIKDLNRTIYNLNLRIGSLESSNKDLQDFIDDFFDTHHNEKDSISTIILSVFSSILVCMIVVEHLLT